MDSSPNRSSDLDDDAHIARNLRRLLQIGRAHESPSYLHPGGQAYTKIGAGSCGAVFAQNGASTVLKVRKNSQFSLWTDFGMHALIASHMRKMEACNHIAPDIPKIAYYIDIENSVRYFDRDPMLEHAIKNECRTPTEILATQRIEPLPKVIRKFLIERYCSAENRGEALRSAANEHCLVRVYLGSMNGKQTRRSFSLQNFKLHLNQIIDLNLNVLTMCTQMATALAVMHWSARTDAGDVEFDLGSSLEARSTTSQTDPEEILSSQPKTTSIGDQPERRTALWLLDFNLVQRIKLDETAIPKIVSAHHRNDPYYPKPCQDHPTATRLWENFARVYLETAEIALRNENKETKTLPLRFLEALVEDESAKLEAGQW